MYVKRNEYGCIYWIKSTNCDWFIVIKRIEWKKKWKEHIISTHQIAVNPIEVKLAEDDEDIEDL